MRTGACSNSTSYREAAAKENKKTVSTKIHAASSDVVGGGCPRQGGTEQTNCFTGYMGCQGSLYPADEEWSIHVTGYQVLSGALASLAFR
mmetsp:Transcript_36386/g.70061  ORF Transcript_36386/g.70061 Transcript_36386/m.70061 type:complete len:90 (+) Transcript_36386:248-517(+)